MSRTWGRLYAGTRNHRKIKILAEQFPDHWASWYVLIELAIECDDDGWIYLAPDVPFTIKQIGKEIGIRRKDVCERFLKSLESLKLLTISDQGILLNSFSERNYESDISTPRVQKYREKRKSETQNETVVKRFSNVSETDQNRTETEQRQNKTDIPPKSPKGGNGVSLNSLAIFWNKNAPESLSRVRTPFSRPTNEIKKLEAAIRRHNDIDWWCEPMVKIGSIPGLLGQNERGWRLTFDDFILKAEKILDGKYDNWGKPMEGKSCSQPGIASWLAREDKNEC